MSNVEAVKYNEVAMKELSFVMDPLKESLQAQYFVYSRVYKDGSRVHFSNHYKWVNASLSLNIHDRYEHIQNLITKTPRGIPKLFLRASNPDSNNPVLLNLYKYDMWNGVSIATKGHDIFELFSVFSGKKNNSIAPYINNREFLEKFTLYFREKAADFIEKSAKIKTTPLTSTHFNFEDITDLKSNERFIIRQTQLPNFRININNKLITLSHREVECLYLLYHGYSAQAVSVMLNISPRTIETHINNIKIKTSIYNRSEIIERVLSSSQLKYFLDIELEHFLINRRDAKK